MVVVVLKCQGHRNVCNRLDATLIPCRTMYHHESIKEIQKRVLIEVDATLEELSIWNKKYNPDPNQDLMLCSQCAIDYNSDWDDMWKEYHAGLL